MIIRNRIKKNDAKENQSTINWSQPPFVVEGNRETSTTKLSEKQLEAKQKTLGKM